MADASSAAERRAPTDDGGLSPDARHSDGDEARVCARCGRSRWRTSSAECQVATRKPGCDVPVWLTQALSVWLAAVGRLLGGDVRFRQYSGNLSQGTCAAPGRDAVAQWGVRAFVWRCSGVCLAGRSLGVRGLSAECPVGVCTVLSGVLRSSGGNARHDIRSRSWVVLRMGRSRGVERHSGIARRGWSGGVRARCGGRPSARPFVRHLAETGISVREPEAPFGSAPIQPVIRGSVRQRIVRQPGDYP